MKKIKNLRDLAKANKWYLLTSILGLLLTILGGIYYQSCIGVITLAIGLISSICGIFIGLNSNGIQWIDVD
ncbi:MAG: hypothetical protein IJY36_08535 [Coprobacter sp.]|nr:hypothetical protein [Coprobacter sp.]